VGYLISYFFILDFGSVVLYSVSTYCLVFGLDLLSCIRSRPVTATEKGKCTYKRSVLIKSVRRSKDKDKKYLSIYSDGYGLQSQFLKVHYY